MNSETHHLRLTWRDPATTEQRELTAALPISIGRHPDNTLVLSSKLLSGNHALLQVANHQLQVIDLDSRNGVLLNGASVDGTATLTNGDFLQVGPFSFHVDWRGLPTAKPQQVSVAPTVLDTTFTSQSLTNVMALPVEARTAHMEFPPAVFANTKVNLSDLAHYSNIETVTYLTIGGGLGSFVWVDHLRVFGVPTQEIASIGFESKPQDRFVRLAGNSQIPNHERLRSNSDACPDNLWGWPGYAVREIWSDVTHGRLKNAANVSWQIFNEPFVQTYTPKKGQVFSSLDTEAKRISWQAIARQGRARAIRKTTDGRYVVAWSQQNADGSTTHRLMVCTYLHLAVGYPRIRFLPDLQKYREETGDQMHVLNAYEEHDDVYDDLAANGGTVLIRGRGIVASRIIQRIYETRQASGAQIHIVHLMRTPLTQGSQYGYVSRDVHNHWELQPFNWPKACWGGPMRNQLEHADDETRKALFKSWGGTTTADRNDWREMVEIGLQEGWYEIHFGHVSEVTQAANGQVLTHLLSSSGAAKQTQLLADYIIDATGLIAEIDQNALLADLCAHHHLPRNGQNRLPVTADFEIEALQNGAARMYACGVATLGGPYAAVDSFLGLQYAAQRSVYHLAKQRAPRLRRLNGVRSFNQWTRWARGVAP